MSQGYPSAPMIFPAAHSIAFDDGLEYLFSISTSGTSDTLAVALHPYQGLLNRGEDSQRRHAKVSGGRNCREGVTGMVTKVAAYLVGYWGSEGM